MKTFILTRIVGALLALVVASGAFAASDYLLEIEGIKGACDGKHFKLTENADGTFTAENIPAGTYKLIAKPVVVANPGTGTPSRDKLDFHFEYTVSPRDVASGQSSGKRQQNMMAIQKHNVRLDADGVVLGQIRVGMDHHSDNSMKSKPPKKDTTKVVTEKPCCYDLKIAKAV